MDRTPDLVNAMNVGINDDAVLRRESFRNLAISVEVLRSGWSRVECGGSGAGAQSRIPQVSRVVAVLMASVACSNPAAQVPASVPPPTSARPRSAPTNRGSVEFAAAGWIARLAGDTLEVVAVDAALVPPFVWLDPHTLFSANPDPEGVNLQGRGTELRWYVDGRLQDQARVSEDTWPTPAHITIGIAGQEVWLQHCRVAKSGDSCTSAQVDSARVTRDTFTPKPLPVGVDFARATNEPGPWPRPPTVSAPDGASVAIENGRVRCDRGTMTMHYPDPATTVRWIRASPPIFEVELADHHRIYGEACLQDLADDYADLSNGAFATHSHGTWHIRRGDRELGHLDSPSSIRTNH